MCTAFVNGIDATNASATTPCDHQVAKCALEACCVVIPSPWKPRPTTHPTGDQVSKDGFVCAIRNASSRKPLSARKKSEARKTQSPIT